jgi:hypothetical protein
VAGPARARHRGPGPGSWAAIRGAADAAQTAADLVSSGTPAAYALCRPPGHHATRDAYGGSCYLNNAAIAAEALRAAGAARVAVLDIDAHHGNGTQMIFWDRADVWYGSLHVDPGAGWFPHYAGRRGAQDGVLEAAPGLGDGAARVEPAAGRHVHGVRRLTLEDLRRAALPGVTVQDDGQQGPGVGVLRVADDVPGRALLHDPAQVHDRDAVSEVRGRGQVVGDHEDPHVAVPAQPVQRKGGTVP